MERLDPRMLANVPVFVRYRDVEVPGWFPRQVERLDIYLELVVRGRGTPLLRSVGSGRLAFCGRVPQYMPIRWWWNLPRTSRTNGCRELCSRHFGAM